MSNLFMPKDQKELDDLISGKPVIVNSSDEVIVFSDWKYLYVRENLESQIKVWKERKSSALNYHEAGILYEATHDGWVYDAFSDNIINKHEGEGFSALAYHNNLLYVGTKNGDVCELYSKKVVRNGDTADLIAGLCSHKGELYYGFDNLVFDVFTNDEVIRLDGLLNKLYSDGEALYALTTNGIQSCTNSYSSFYGRNIFSIFNFGNKFYYVDTFGDILNSSEEKVGSFGNDNIFDIAIVPKGFVEDVL